MSEAHIAKFAEIVVQDPEMYARLGLEQVSDEAGGRAFVSKAIKEAKAAGLEFTEAEGYEWMKKEAAAVNKGELSDSQLEGVAGGKSRRQQFRDLNRVSEGIQSLGTSELARVLPPIPWNRVFSGW